MPRRQIPLFPLPLVLFPGATLPLHIFEPRYRQMLADCQTGDRAFGIVMSDHQSEPAWVYRAAADGPDGRQPRNDRCR